MPDAGSRLLDRIEEVGGDALRDVWVFDTSAHRSLYLREDVAAELEPLEVERYIDNERYGYLSRETYESLHYATYEYTVRGFDEFEQFRTFLFGDDVMVGLFASFDREAVPCDYGVLYDAVVEATADVAVADLAPSGE